MHGLLRQEDMLKHARACPSMLKQVIPNQSKPNQSKTKPIQSKTNPNQTRKRFIQYLKVLYVGRKTSDT